MTAEKKLPDGWEVKKLGEVCEIFGGGTPSTKNEAYWQGDIPWVSPKDMKSKFISDSIDHISETALHESATNVIQEGSLLIVVRSGILAHTIPLGITKKRVSINQDLKALLPKNIVVIHFLYYYFLSIEGILLSQVTKGATVHRLQSETLFDISTPLPPLPEQKRIISILDEAFQAIDRAKENAEKNLANAREVFDGYLNQVFTNPGKDWELVKLSELTVDISDGDHMPPPKAKTGIPFITISNINKGNHCIDFSDTFLVPEIYYENLKQNRKAQKGDVLFTVTGSYGIPVLIESDIKFCFQRHIGLLRPNSECKAKLLFYWIFSKQCRKQADESATGTAQKTVSLGSLRNFLIYKIPLNEQEYLVQKLDSISAETLRLKSIYQKKIAALDELKKSIMQKAFSGEL